MSLFELVASAFAVCLKFFGVRGSKQTAGVHVDICLSTLFKVLAKYGGGGVDYVKFTKDHWAMFEAAETKTREYSPCICHYYEVMADVITFACGPFWHFVPCIKGDVGRKESLEQFQRVLVKSLDGKPGNDILELGAGFGECGRRVAELSGANVTSLTLADCEIVEGTKRIAARGLEKQCKMVQGNYHDLHMIEDSSLDAVFGIYTLKYSADLDKVLKEAHRVLKPGGRFVSYEILTSDTYDPDNCPEEKEWVRWISASTGMPPLWCAKDFRSKAQNAGFVNAREEDITREGDLSWWRMFDSTIWMLESRVTYKLVQLGESIGLLRKGFAQFYDTFLVHPTVDFVKSGRKGVVSCTLMMTWDKPAKA